MSRRLEVMTMTVVLEIACLRVGFRRGSRGLCLGLFTWNSSVKEPRLERYWVALVGHLTPSTLSGRSAAATETPAKVRFNGSAVGLPIIAPGGLPLLAL